MWRRSSLLATDGVCSGQSHALPVQLWRWRPSETCPSRDSRPAPRYSRTLSSSAACRWPRRCSSTSGSPKSKCAHRRTCRRGELSISPEVKPSPGRWCWRHNRRRRNHQALQPASMPVGRSTGAMHHMPAMGTVLGAEFATQTARAAVRGKRALPLIRSTKQRRKPRDVLRVTLLYHR